MPVIDTNLQKHYDVLTAASTFIQLQIFQNLINVDDDDDEKEYNVLKKNQASLLTKKVSIHLFFFFLMKVAAQVPCWLHEYKFTKIYPTFMSLDGVLFGRRGRDFHAKQYGVCFNFRSFSTALPPKIAYFRIFLD